MSLSDQRGSEDALVASITRPRTRNRAFQSAFRRGIRDRLAGRSRYANPYPDLRTHYHEGNTFSRAFRRYWQEGWTAADAYLCGGPEP